MAGRRSAEDYGKTRRLLTAEEESTLLWRCDILQRSGWSQTPEDVRILAYGSETQMLKLARTRFATVCINATLK